jgi:hypothetical protein
LKKKLETLVKTALALIVTPLLSLSFAQTATPAAVPAMPGVSFAPAVEYETGGQSAISVAIADVNGDGKLDLVVANNCASVGHCNKPGSVGVLLGNGDGTFAPAVAYLSGGLFAKSVAVADVNGDGKPDIVVANACLSNTDCEGAVGVLSGNGDGTFQPVIAYVTGGYEAYAVAVADVNRDGNSDLVVANLCADGNCKSNGVVSVLLGRGHGKFGPAETYDSGGLDARSVAVADVNGDGKPDIVVANICQGSDCSTITPGSVGVLFGNGDGTFKPVIAHGTSGYSTEGVTVADVNGDGIPDLVVANSCENTQCANGTIGLLIGNGDGTFQSALPFGSGGTLASAVAVADLDGNGTADLIAANASSQVGDVGVLLGNPDGTFQTAVNFHTAGYYSESLAVGDLNGDGKPDVVVTSLGACARCTSGGVGVLLNTSP